MQQYEKLSDPDLLERISHSFEYVENQLRHGRTIAVPQYYNGRIQFILPLYLQGQARADFAVIVDKSEWQGPQSRAEKQYKATTILPLAHAFSNARLLGKPDRSWLLPSTQAPSARHPTPPYQAAREALDKVVEFPFTDLTDGIGPSLTVREYLSQLDDALSHTDRAFGKARGNLLGKEIVLTAIVTAVVPIFSALVSQWESFLLLLPQVLTTVVQLWLRISDKRKIQDRL